MFYYGESLVGSCCLFLVSQTPVGDEQWALFQQKNYLSWWDCSLAISITTFYFFSIIHKSLQGSSAGIRALYCHSFILIVMFYSVLIEESVSGCMWNLESCRVGISMCQVKHPGDICLRTTVWVFRAQVFPSGHNSLCTVSRATARAQLCSRSSCCSVGLVEQNYWSCICKATVEKRCCMVPGWHNTSSSLFFFVGVSTEPGCPLSCVSGADKSSCTVDLCSCRMMEVSWQNWARLLQPVGLCLLTAPINLGRSRRSQGTYVLSVVLVKK